VSVNFAPVVDTMDLLCGEKLTDSRTARRDSVIYDDFRVLHNLLDMELVYMPTCNYFTLVQHDIQPYQRKIVATWMLEVSLQLIT